MLSGATYAGYSSASCTNSVAYAGCRPVLQEGDTVSSPAVLRDLHFVEIGQNCAVILLFNWHIDFKLFRNVTWFTKTVNSVSHLLSQKWSSTVTQGHQRFSVVACNSVGSVHTHVATSYCINFCRAMRCISAAYVVMQCLCVCLSLSLSVCVCVCLSRSWVVSKRINISSKFFHHRVATPL